MGFDLEAFVGRRSDLRKWQEVLGSAVVCELSGELALVPLTDLVFRALRGRLGEEAERLDAAWQHRTYPSPAMNEGVRRWGAEASRNAAVAHVSIGEFGDTSYEYVTVWRDGAVVLSGGGLRAVLDYFRDQVGMDLGDEPIDLEIHRGEDAAEKWAAAAPRSR